MLDNLDNPRVKQVINMIDLHADDFYEGAVIACKIQEPVPKFLVHYAPLDALHPILESGVLWASDLRYTNDLSEIHHPVNVVLSVLSHLSSCIQNNNQYESMSPDVSSDILENPLGYLVKCLSESIKYFGYYSVSFCETAEKISQWRAYAADGAGVALKFDASWPGSDQNETGGWTRIRVRYDEEPLQEVSRKAVRFLESLSGSPEINDLRKQLAPHEAATVGQYLISKAVFFLAPIMMRFKDNFFHEEDEWRIARVFVKGDETADIRHHSRRGVFTPYIPLPYRLRMKDHAVEAELAKGDPVPVLTDVILGPRADPRSKDALEAFFARKGADVKVRQHSAPLK